VIDRLTEVIISSPWVKIPNQSDVSKVLLLTVAFCLGQFTQPAEAALSTDSPIRFFTNVASRLLESDAALAARSSPYPGYPGFPAGLDSIQVYPTNQYTPAVHRVLQVAANLYDAATSRCYGTTNAFPTIFRPLFLTTQTNGTQVFIVGYEELTNHAGLISNPPAMRRFNDTTNIWVDARDLVLGIPLVIGAKKGFPNFNELELRTKIEVARKLEFIKNLATDKYPQATNQMYLLSITNEFGIEAWNSFTNVYPRNLQMIIAAEFSATITDDSGAMTYFNSAPYSNYVWFATAPALLIPGNSWHGSNPLFPNPSFAIPFAAGTSHFMCLTNSSYSFINNAFISPAQTSFEIGQGFPVPRWWFNLASSMRFVLYDTDAQRIVDYVNLAAASPSFDITTSLFHGAVASGRLDGGYGSMFLTNRVGTTQASPTYGIINQIYAGLGMNSNNLVWNYANSFSPPGWNIQGAINFFRTNLLQLPAVGVLTGPLYPTNHFYCPYNAVRDMYLYTSWQANDPLVHYTVGDLTPSNYTTNCDWDISVRMMSTIGNIGTVNSAYEPWPGSSLGSASASSTITDLRVKDPRITCSDDWTFPVDTTLDTASLGQVHRGTPWQTLYLKSAVVDYPTWTRWAGAGTWSWFYGVLMQPRNDWRHVALLAPLFNTNSPTTLWSVNQPNAGAWASLLDGLTAWNNLSGGSPSSFTISSNSAGAAAMAGALDALRLSQPAGVFTDVGQILAVPQLSVGSPWLNTNYQVVPLDADLEALPAQLIARLRPDSIAVASQGDGGISIRFTGLDDFTYGVQVSTDLLNWTTVTTNNPSNGFFDYVEPPALALPARFFRSTILP